MKTRPSLSARSQRRSSTTARIAAVPVAIASGLPPKVEPWAPFGILSATASVVTMAPRGKPPPKGLARVRTSGVTP